MNSEGERKEGKEVALFSKSISSFEQADRIADYIAGSSTYNKAFLEIIDVEEEVDTEDGIESEDKKIITVKKTVANKQAIVVCLMLGQELGFNPLESIMMGKRLNQQAVIKVHQGRDFGLSAITAMQHIHIFEAGGREIIYTDIHVVNKVLTDNNIQRVILDDGSKPFYIYKDFKTREDVDYNEDYHVCVNMGLSKTELEEGLKAGKIAVTRIGTRRGLVQLTRGKEVIAIPYTLIQATEAGLYKGKNSDGEEVKGKANWNNHPETHLLKMSIMLGGRIIASDKLNGIYEMSELGITKSKDNTNNVDDAIVVD